MIRYTGVVSAEVPDVTDNYSFCNREKEEREREALNRAKGP
jgi:hypothetical protein